MPAHPAATSLQAVVLAGVGRDLYPLTDDGETGDTTLPKALLPVATRPMLFYQLQWLEQAGISSILVVCNKAAAHKLSNYIAKVYEQAAETDIAIEVMEQAAGTAHALRQVKDKIKVLRCTMRCNAQGCYALTPSPPNPPNRPTSSSCRATSSPPSPLTS